jgi:hypothetical protein
MHVSSIDTINGIILLRKWKKWYKVVKIGW